MNRIDIGEILDHPWYEGGIDMHNKYFFIKQNLWSKNICLEQGDKIIIDEEIMEIAKKKNLKVIEK